MKNTLKMTALALLLSTTLLSANSYAEEEGSPEESSCAYEDAYAACIADGGSDVEWDDETQQWWCVGTLEDYVNANPEEEPTEEPVVEEPFVEVAIENHEEDIDLDGVLDYLDADELDDTIGAIE